jgi:hypothetical protein
VAALLFLDGTKAGAGSVQRDTVTQILLEIRKKLLFMGERESLNMA